MHKCQEWGRTPLQNSVVGTDNNLLRDASQIKSLPPINNNNNKNTKVAICCDRMNRAKR